MLNSVKQRASYQVDSVREAALLRRFASPHGLEGVRSMESGLRETYIEEEAVFLFSDIVHFSAIAAKIGAERTAKLMKTVLSAQADAIEKAGGEIDKFVGDAVVAFWLGGSTLESRQAAARKAVQAAKDIVAALVGVQDPRDENESIKVRIGLHAGPAFSGDFGSTKRSAFTFLGHNVNVAARIEQARDTDVVEGHRQLGSIRVSECLYDLLPENSRFGLDQRSVVNVKGTRVPVFSDGVEACGPGYSLDQFSK